MKVLITGGLGYVGSRVARLLSALGYHVICTTRERKRKPFPLGLENVSLAYPDWHSSNSLSKICKGVDCVIHLAAMNEVESILDPCGALDANGQNTLRLLIAARKAGVRRFIYFSTAHVYGSPLSGCVLETNVPRPIHPYAISHRVAEDFVLAYHDQGDFEGAVIRLSNAFGAPLVPEVNRWTLLVNDLCKQAVVSGALRLNSTGKHLRDFITLEDVARAVQHLLTIDSSSLENGLFNVGSGKSISVIDMANKIAARWQYITGNSIPLTHLPDDGKRPTPLCYCCDKFFSTGFALTSQFEQEIDDTISLCIGAFGKRS